MPIPFILHPVIFILSLHYILSYGYDFYFTNVKFMPLAFFHMPPSGFIVKELSIYYIKTYCIPPCKKPSVFLPCLVCHFPYLPERFIEPGKQIPN